MPFTVIFSVPPSSNNLWSNAKHGRYRTSKYNKWRNTAGWEIAAQRPRPVSGRYSLELVLPTIRGDIDNRLKATNDLLKMLGLIEDDRLCRALNVRLDSKAEKAVAIVTEM